MENVVEKEMTTQPVGMSLYDINKSMMEQKSPLTSEELDVIKDIIWNWTTKNVAQENSSLEHYYMLLGREINYYTLFHVISDVRYDGFDNLESLEKEFIECLNDLGEPVAIEETEDGNAIEVWIKLRDSKNVTVLYLFNYDRGVIHCL